jgi:hypothetical protein
VHRAAVGDAVLLELLKIEIEVGENVVLDLLRLSRSASNSGRRAAALLRLSMKPSRMLPSARCNSASPSARTDASLK